MIPPTRDKAPPSTPSHRFPSDILDVPTMRAFVMLMQERSVSKAARSMGLSQPALSRLLARLRVAFNDQMLVPAHGRLIPTLRAEKLLVDIEAILGSISCLLDNESHFDARSARMKFVVSASEVFEYMLLPAFHKALEINAPGMEVQFMAPDRTQVDTWLADGTVDFRLAPLRYASSRLHVRQLFTDEWVCIARRNHPDLDSSISLEDYARATHVCVDVAGFTTGEQLIEVALGKKGYGRERILRVQSALAVPHIVAQSNSVAAVPSRLAHSFSNLDLQILKLPVETDPLVCSIFWHERTHRSPAHEWFRTLFTEVARDTLRGCAAKNPVKDCRPYAASPPHAKSAC